MIQIIGLERVQRLLNNLPKEIEKQIGDKGTHELAINLQNRMKRRVPVGNTGWLRKSIMVEKIKRFQEAVVISAFYAMAIEKGSKLHPIPVEYLEQHLSNPGSPGQRVKDPKGYIMAGGPPRPFIQPSITSFINQLPKLLEMQLNKAMQGARR